MTEYKSLKIPAPLADIIDKLVESGEFSSRADFTKDAIRESLRKRGLMK